jgi:hypothetical protein
MRPLWTGDEIAAATGGRLSRPFEVNGVAFDSREVIGGELFVAVQLEGNREGALLLLRPGSTHPVELARSKQWREPRGLAWDGARHRLLMCAGEGAGAAGSRGSLAPSGRERRENSNT